MITEKSLADVDKHWAVSAFEDAKRVKLLEIASTRLVQETIGKQLHVQVPDNYDYADLERLATAYELAAIEGLNELLYQTTSDKGKPLREQAQAGAYRAFELRRALPLPENEEERFFQVLHLAALAYCGDRWADIRRWLKEHHQETQIQHAADQPWDHRILGYLYECWLKLLRKDGWDDLSSIAGIIAKLRDEQKQYEPQVLQQEQGPAVRATAFRLIALYHWARATEILATYMLQGEPVSVGSELDQHFEAALEAATLAQDPSFEVILRWLYATSRQMVQNSIWRSTQAISPQITRFVRNVTKSRSLFELLPPQKAALQEQGLLDQAHKAIVVDMPTSGGKTLLAQFKMLQALNQFDVEKGWVAYVAPTRALVSQQTRRLREDFEPLGVRVEHLSSAIELDSFEEGMLSSQADEVPFHILVATPEKLSLVVRNKRVHRPLCLLIMDEAQNIEDEERGLRIELLIATVKRDCLFANFLLMMPYVPNATDLVHWLSPESGKAISLGTIAWQANERVIGIYDVTHPAEAKKGDWTLTFKTLATTNKTINLHGEYTVGGNRPLKMPYSQARQTHISQTGAMARIFSDKGTSIAIARTIPEVWSMAATIAKGLTPVHNPEIALVQRFLATEVSPEFELIRLLDVGVAVHHAGLPEEARSLIEWLAEKNKLRVLCATTTLSQGINFPVSSVFLASRFLPVQGRKEMSKISFWNLAGRAGRLDQDSVGVVGLCAGEKPDEIVHYVSEAIDNLLSRFVHLLDEIEQEGELHNLTRIIQDEQWSDFRSYIAHLWNEKQNLDLVLSETEQILRNTYGYNSLQANPDSSESDKAQALLKATRSYAQSLSDHTENTMLADATGFSPEGVRAALHGLRHLGSELDAAAWQPANLFGDVQKSALPQLIGLMMRIPELHSSFQDLEADGIGQAHIAGIAQDWVMGRSIEEIARTYFLAQEGDTTPADLANVSSTALTSAITNACKGIYRALASGGTWGISAFSKLPTAGIDFDTLPDETRQAINNLPAMLYHGVRSNAAVLMRMNGVPRSIAESLGAVFTRQREQQAKVQQAENQSMTDVRQFLRSLKPQDWDRARPANAAMSGSDYQRVWAMIAGERI